MLVLCFVFNVWLCTPVAKAQVVENTKVGVSLVAPDSWKVIYGHGEGNGTLLFRVFDNEKSGRIIVSAMPPFPIAVSNADYGVILQMFIKQFYSKCPDAKVEVSKKDTIANQDAYMAVFSYPRKDGGRDVMLKAAFWVNDTMLDISAVSKEEDSEQEMKTFLEMVKSIKLNQMTGLEWAKQGYTYKQSGNYEKAREAFSMASKVQAKNYDNYYELAYASAEVSDYAQAVNAISKAIELKPKMAFYYFERSYSYYKLKNAEAALADANQALQLDPKKGIFYSCRGNAYALLNKYPEAIADFNKCLELNGDPEFTRFNLGQAYELAGDKEKALYNYKIASGISKLMEQHKTKVQARINGDWDSYKEWI